MKKTVVRLIDDLDGTEAAGCVQFSLYGVSYEIDLSTANEKEFQATMARYTDAGRRTRRTPDRGVAASSRTDRTLNQEIRQWAALQGKVIAARGRIPQEILDQYAAARR